MWRPGLQVKAFAKTAGSKPREAVAVPETAVLFHQGRALVYVRREAGKYERREVRLLGHEGDRWILNTNQGVNAPRSPGRANLLLCRSCVNAPTWP